MTVKSEGLKCCTVGQSSVTALHCWPTRGPVVEKLLLRRSLLLRPLLGNSVLREMEHKSVYMCAPVRAVVRRSSCLYWSPTPDAGDISWPGSPAGSVYRTYTCQRSRSSQRSASPPGRTEAELSFTRSLFFLLVGLHWWRTKFLFVFRTCSRPFPKQTSHCTSLLTHVFSITAAENVNPLPLFFFLSSFSFLYLCSTFF